MPSVKTTNPAYCKSKRRRKMLPRPKKQEKKAIQQREVRRIKERARERTIEEKNNKSTLNSSRTKIEEARERRKAT